MSKLSLLYRASFIRPGTLKLPLLRQSFHCSTTRPLLGNPEKADTSPRDFAFAFDIDGVLLRSSKPLPRARQALAYLQERRIPFILLTNGGGKSEESRVAELNRLFGIELALDLFIQSHTPFADLVHATENNESGLQDKTVLVIGGDGENCRQIASKIYGFRDVIIPADLICAFPSLWPFASPETYRQYARPLARNRLSPRDLSQATDRSELVKIDAILVFNDPRDWALDIQIVLDLLMSEAGYLGSYSPRNGQISQDNHGWQSDRQPELYFSNPDLVWAAEYHLPRLGQGGFREALEGIWHAVTFDRSKSGKSDKKIPLRRHMYGKPYTTTYQFAEKRLQRHYKLLRGSEDAMLKRIYMVGDNPASDIQGANTYSSPYGSSWRSILVETGVYNSGSTPAITPTRIVKDVFDAVQWSCQDAAK